MKDNTEFYRISVKDFEMILLNEPSIKSKMNETIESSVIPLILRLSECIVYYINKFQDQETHKQISFLNEKKNSNEKEKPPPLSSNIAA